MASQQSGAGPRPTRAGADGPVHTQPGAPPRAAREALGERPTDARKLEAWNQGVAEIHSYRQRQGVTDPKLPIGAEPKDPAARADFTRTQQAIRAAQRRLELGREPRMERGLETERDLSMGR